MTLKTNKINRPPDLKSSSNVSLPFAWITGPATVPSYIKNYNSNWNKCFGPIVRQETDIKAQKLASWDF